MPPCLVPANHDAYILQLPQLAAESGQPSVQPPCTALPPSLQARRPGAHLLSVVWWPHSPSRHSRQSTTTRSQAPKPCRPQLTTQRRRMRVRASRERHSQASWSRSAMQRQESLPAMQRSPQTGMFSTGISPGGSSQGDILCLTMRNVAPHAHVGSAGLPACYRCVRWRLAVAGQHAWQSMTMAARVPHSSSETPACCRCCQTQATRSAALRPVRALLPHTQHHPPAALVMSGSAPHSSRWSTWAGLPRMAAQCSEVAPSSSAATVSRVTTVGSACEGEAHGRADLGACTQSARSAGARRQVCLLAATTDAASAGPSPLQIQASRPAAQALTQ